MEKIGNVFIPSWMEKASSAERVNFALEIENLKEAGEEIVAAAERMAGGNFNEGFRLRGAVEGAKVSREMLADFQRRYR